MNVFTEVYNRAVELLKSESLDPSWKGVESGLRCLLKQQGPEEGHAKALQDVRDTIEKAASGQHVKRAAAAEILKAAVVERKGFQDRAAHRQTCAV